MSDLEQIRKSINQYDEKIIEYLSLRFKEIQKVAEIKKEKHLSIYDQKREKEIIKNIEESDIYCSLEVSEIYEAIMKASRKYQSKQLLPNKIFLIGFMGAGKTTVGKILSQITGFEFVDTDQIIEEKAQMKIFEIFRKKGDKYFRDIETEVLQGLKDDEHRIVSCGGGIILKQENRDFLKENGKTIFLDGDIRTMMNRVEDNDTRPVIVPILRSDPKKKYEAFKDILDKRMPFYKEAADMTIKIDDKTPQEISEEILKELI